MTMEQTKALHAVAEAVVETIKESGPNGAPGGYLYTALMVYGFTLEQFEILMDTLIQIGKVKKSGHCYFAA